MNTSITGVRSGGRGASGLTVAASRRADERFDVVVNALWQERPSIDLAMGIQPPTRLSHRYRVSAFVRTARHVNMPSTLITTGPFGDVKNFNGRDFYLSWYPAGLLAEGHAPAPPPAPALSAHQRAGVAAAIWRGLGQVATRTSEIADSAEECRIEGGWVYAAGDGSLADPAATLHQRHNIGISRSQGYISVDTGKYSMAPLLAREIADLVG